jgi:site-specific DNA-methyltransferase (adenine-specific)
MKRRFGTYTIKQTDSLTWLKARRAKSVHAVVTDPPFGIIEFTSEQLNKRKNGNGGIWRLPHNYDGNERSPTPRFTVLRESDLEKVREFHDELARLLFRILVPGGHVIMASQTIVSYHVLAAFSEAGFEVRGQVARIVRTLRGGDRPKGAHRQYSTISVLPRSCWEPWLIFRKPCEGTVKDNLKRWKTGGLRRPEKDKPFQDLIVSRPARGQEKTIAPHPSLKPQAFVRQIVRAALPLGEGIVLDPFMGSGSIIAAASALGFRSVGLEKQKDYFRMARRAIPKLAALTIDANGSASPLKNKT